MKTKLLLSVALALVLVLMFLGGCTPGTNQLKDTPNEQLAVAGFWRGLWQGFRFDLSVCIPDFPIQERSEYI